MFNELLKRSQQSQNKRASSTSTQYTGTSAPLQNQIPNSAMLSLLGSQQESFQENAYSPNKTGLPDAMKARFERLAGLPLDDVRVHRNSDKPADFDALAYASGNEIHLGPGQEMHLGHELGHVVQQKTGMVKPNSSINGTPVNDDPLLENEAQNSDVTISSAHVCTTQAPVVQCCRHDKKCKNNDPCPTHEKRYSQKTDPTLQPFIRKNHRYVGESAMRLQDTGKPAAASQVRVAAVEGAGLHEILPTDMRNSPHDIPGLPGVQSGARTDAGMTVFRTPVGFCGHTGTFANAQGRNTMLTGQAAAHDTVRDKLKRLRKDGVKTREEAILSLAASGIRSLANGAEILDSPSIKHVRVKRTKRRLGKARSKERIAFAQQQHETREHMKRRHAKLSDYRGVKRSTSPERTPIRKDGSGGGFMTAADVPRSSSPLPFFEGKSPSELSANESAYIFAPGRRRHKSESMLKTCGHCGTSNYQHVHYCQKCNKLL